MRRNIGDWRQLKGWKRTPLERWWRSRPHLKRTPPAKQPTRKRRLPRRPRKPHRSHPRCPADVRERVLNRPYVSDGEVEEMTSWPASDAPYDEYDSVMD